MKTSSDFEVSEIEKLITIANLCGVEVDKSVSPSVSLYLDGIIEQIKKVPYNPFPTAFHTVDVLIYKTKGDGKVDVLLGRKPGKTAFQVIGGFVEPAQSAEDAAIREVLEETNIKLTDAPNYIGSFFIDDERYRQSCHKITTSLFYAFVHDETEAKGQDDIEEVKWFAISELKENYKTMVIEPHHILIEQIVPGQLN